MIPTTGTQAADITSESMKQKWWEIPPCHILSYCSSLWTAAWSECLITTWGGEKTKKKLIRLITETEGGMFGLLQNSSHDPLHMVKAISQYNSRRQEMRSVQRLKRLQKKLSRDALTERNVGYMQKHYYTKVALCLQQLLKFVTVLCTF